MMQPPDDEEPPADQPPDKVQIPDFVSFLPEQLWYLTQSGSEMWCRRPYGFFFTTSDSARDFAAAMGTDFELTPIGVGSMDLVGPAGIEGVRRIGVTRLFLDPKIDPASGEVFGKILRLEPVN